MSGSSICRPPVGQQRLRRRQCASGFTLVEVIITAAVLTTSLVMIFRGLSVCMQAAKRSERYTVAAMLVQHKIAELEIEEELDNGEEQGDFEEQGHPGLRWRVVIEDAEDVENLQKVTITVSWPAGQSEQNIEVVRLFAVPVEPSEVE